MAFKEYRFDAWRLWAATANDAEAAPCVAEPDPEAGRKRIKRKACRRDTKRSLKKLKGLPSPVGWLGPADIKRSWLRERCARCLRCPRMIRKLDITPRYVLLRLVEDR